MPPPDAQDVGSGQAQPDNQPKAVVTCPECGTPSDAKLSRAIKVVTSRLVPWVVVGIAVVFVGVMTVVTVESVTVPFDSLEEPRTIQEGFTIASLRDYVGDGAPDLIVGDALAQHLTVSYQEWPPKLDDDVLEVGILGPASGTTDSFTIGWPISLAAIYEHTHYANLHDPTERITRLPQEKFVVRWSETSLTVGSRGQSFGIDLGAVAMLLLVLVLIRWLSKLAIGHLQAKSRRAQNCLGRSLVGFRISRLIGAAIPGALILIVLAGSVLTARSTSTRELYAGDRPIHFPRRTTNTRSDIRDLVDNGNGESELAQLVLDRLPTYSHNDSTVTLRFVRMQPYTLTVSSVGWPLVSSRSFRIAPPESPIGKKAFLLNLNGMIWGFGDTYLAGPNLVIQFRPIALAVFGLYVLYQLTRSLILVVFSFRARKRRRRGNCTACGYDLTALTAGATGRLADGEQTSAANNR